MEAQVLDEAMTGCLLDTAELEDLLGALTIVQLIIV